MTDAAPHAGMHGPAVGHLAGIDADWARLIRCVGPCTHRPEAAREPCEALIRAVAYQQLHARAADAIVARFLGLYPQPGFPQPERILATPRDILRTCGFSGRKVDTVLGIAQGTLDGVVPSRRAADGMSDDELIARLTTLPGIGRWTVEMLLIFTLGRQDVLPADDFGIREGYRFLKSLDVAPGRREMERTGLPWRPYRTVAAWYLWRVPLLPDYRRKG
ncbi:DNA-3-methyladenine glycosylase [Nitrosovibrio sp. Nv17]|uniref:DNA-3-methyladenine glycosylase family protein n=1 Tax=Nitrosovibrio sp. Nv17 TaxID=1855339 RepID=UPI0009086C6A|nr:DNA-3-methyladenine glycosylase [Nitrosovibrio sp. Nv17]SFW40133.1 DNA-3-methyladenine glycosylase II [Nitrosovibrio sp. Nv17]